MYSLVVLWLVVLSAVSGRVIIVMADILRDFNFSETQRATSGLDIKMVVWSSAQTRPKITLIVHQHRLMSQRYAKVKVTLRCWEPTNIHKENL